MGGHAFNLLDSEDSLVRVLCSCVMNSLLNNKNVLF